MACISKAKLSVGCVGFIDEGTIILSRMRCLTPARYNEDSHLIVPTCGSPGDRNGPVAQLVEHRTFNAVVAGSSPARLTILSLLFAIS